MQALLREMTKKRVPDIGQYLQLMYSSMQRVFIESLEPGNVLNSREPCCASESNLFSLSVSSTCWSAEYKALLTALDAFLLF
jgi:hypothetical protein